MRAVCLALFLACLHMAGCQEPDILLPPSTPFPNPDQTTPAPPCIRNPEAGELFSSDNFPAQYLKDTNCTYNLVASPGKKVHLTFFVVDTEGNQRCNYDYIKVLDSNSSVLHKYCGKNNGNLEVTSSGESLTLHFKSDGVQEGSGFLARWEEVEEAPTLEEANEGSYLVSIPSAFLLSSPEKICVELFSPQDSGEVEVRVFTAEKEEGTEPWQFAKNAVLTESASVSGEEVKCLLLTLPTTTQGDTAMLDVKMTVQGRTTHSYKEVNLLKREDYPLVQTDKGQYKAKDIVKFRIIVLDHNLRPSPVQELEEIWIEDPRNRRRAQWTDVSLDQGLVQEEMVLGEEPELGQWTVNFKAGDLKEKTEFTVSEYVLPKFEVEIQAPPAVFKDAESAEWKVCAKYTHGGSVKGVLSSNFSSKYQSYYRSPPVIKAITADTVVTADDDCATLTLTKEQIKELTEKIERFRLDIEFTEEGTSTTVSESWSGNLESQAILLDIGSSSNSFIVGGFPYTGEIVAKNHDKSPAVSEELEICVRLFKDVQEIRNLFNRRGIWSMDEDEMVETGKKMVDLHYSSKCHSVTTDASGKVKFHVPLIDIPEDVKKLSIKAKAVNRPTNTKTGMTQPEVKLDVTLTPSDSDISLGLSRKERSDLVCNQDFTATVYFSTSSPRPVTLHYQALSKGVIYQSGKLEVEVGSEDALESLVGGRTELNAGDSTPEAYASSTVSSQDIVLPINHKVSPKLKFIVFVNEGNNTLTDSHDYEVEACQEHTVEAEWSAGKVYPGEDVTLSVSAEPGSLCALSATDKSVDLLGNNNKISRDRVARLQEEIGRRKSSQGYGRLWELQNQCPEAYKALRVFESTGIKILTDLPFLTRCQTITDSPNSEEDREGIQPLSASVGSFGGPSGLRARRQTSCPCPQLEISAVVADAPAFEEQTASKRVQGGAGGGGGSGGSGGIGIQLEEPRLSLREYFPETWLFELNTVPESPMQRELKAPHTITTWTGEAICVSPQVGLGVAKPASLLVSQDFFAELRLPYSVKREETFPLNVTVFNYLDIELPLVVTVKNAAGDLDLAEESHSMCIGPKDNGVISIPTRALKLGEVNVTVEATISNSVEECEPVSHGEGFTDALVRPLRVKPEGVPVEKVESDFKCFETGSEKFVMQKLELPTNTVSDSERAWVYVTGDIMAPALQNVGNLVRIPTGCGEQNMVGLVPNIYLLQYLESTAQSEPELEEKAKEYMRIGYRRQRSYNHPNGAYSIWGDKGDKDGSSWLTAFVVKSFSEAAQYIYIDPSSVQRSVDWLMRGQLENGCFEKRGYVHSSYLQGGGSDSSLTPFIVTSILEAATSPSLKLKINMKKLGEAVDCMVKAVNTSDLYSSIVTAHTVSLLASKQRDKPGFQPFLEKAESMQDTLLNFLSGASNTSLTDSEFWEDPKTDNKETSLWRWNYYYATSKAVEMTAYMVMTRVLRGEEAEALDSVKWLAKQRNSQGGFVSTQDTVVALQALSMYSQRVTRIPLDMKVTVTERHESVSQLGVFNLDSSNGLLLQSQKLTKLPSKLELDTSGSGCAMVQTVLRYNVPDSPANAGFELSVEPTEGQLNVCAQYTGSRPQTGMVVMEVEMVSGWEAVDPESLVNDINYEIQRVERGKDDKETVILYFDSWPREQRCVQLEVNQVVGISDTKPALVTVYDYYNTEERATALYKLQ